MQKINKDLIIRKDEYEIIMNCLKHGLGRLKFSRKDVEGLEAELKKAKLVQKEELPEGTVRLNSTVTIEDEKLPDPIQVTVVIPDRADIRQRKISILSPIGTALFGFRKGQKVSWRVPAGKKVFTILEVAN